MAPVSASTNQRSAVLRVEQVDDQRDHGIAVLVAECLQRCLVAVDHHHARACGQYRLGTSQSDRRRSPGHGGNLAFQFSRHRSPPCWGHHNTRRSIAIPSGLSGTKDGLAFGCVPAANIVLGLHRRLSMVRIGPSVTLPRYVLAELPSQRRSGILKTAFATARQRYRECKPRQRQAGSHCSACRPNAAAAAGVRHRHRLHPCH